MDINYSLVDSINFTRHSPERSGRNILQKLVNNYNGNQLKAFSKLIHTFEGKFALEDMYLCLKHAQPTKSLQESAALMKTAQSIAYMKGAKGQTNHQLPKDIYNQISQFGFVDGTVGELIGLGMNSNEEILSYFLIDDGLNSRKRRKMLLDGKYKYIGVGIAPHKIYSMITVILLAEEVKDKK